MVKTSPTREGPSPRSKRMVAEMSNSRTLFWVGVALVIHAVVIVGTSVGYVREKWRGTKPAETKLADESSAAAATTTANPAPTPSPAQAHAGPAPLTAGISDDDKKLNERKNTPEVKRVTDAAKPGELPKNPQHNAFDIDDTPK